VVVDDNTHVVELAISREAKATPALDLVMGIQFTDAPMCLICRSRLHANGKCPYYQRDALVFGAPLQGGSTRKSKAKARKANASKETPPGALSSSRSSNTGASSSRDSRG
jgi:hypothetical protein